MGSCLQRREREREKVRMLALRLFAVVAVALLCTSAVRCSFCDDGDGYVTVFNDDFDGNELNASNWEPVTGMQVGLGRDAWLSPNNTFVENGTLILRAKRQHYKGQNFTSAAVISQNKQYWKYGRFCIRAKLPGAEGDGASDGVWPAHWMMPQPPSSASHIDARPSLGGLGSGPCWPDGGEIDILEMINGDGVAHGTYHWSRLYPKQNCTGQQGNTDVSDSTTVSTWRDYHEYAAEWTPDYIHFLVDGQVYARVNQTSTSSPKGYTPEMPWLPFYMQLNTAIGGPWPRKVTSKTVFPNDHVIDYVRVSQKKSS